MMATPIQIAVAKTDLFLCTVAQHLPRFAIAFIIGFAAGKVVLKCLPKK